MSVAADQGVWARLIGQPAVVAELRAAIDDPAAMTHAWLFTGPPGSGRSVAARAFAAALQCPDGGDGTCHECRTALAGTHADLTVINPEGLSIGVKEAREIVLGASRAPSQGRWQVIIVEDADRLTEQAGNAVLKMIEEPPSRTVVMLCAPSLHPDDISVTIRSRCRLVRLRTPGVEAIADVLVREGVDPALASWSAAASGGHVGRARRLARDEDARLSRKAVLDVPLSLVSLAACFDAAENLLGAAEDEKEATTGDRDVAELEALKNSLGVGARGPGVVAANRGSAGRIKELEDRQKIRGKRIGRDSLDRALVDLAGLYRDALVLMAAPSERLQLNHPDRRADAQELGRRIGPEGALRRIDALLDCRTALEQNVKPQIALEALTVALRLPA